MEALTSNSQAQRSFPSQDPDSPPIQLTRLQTSVGGPWVHVVREDQLPGGTKQRAAIPFLRHFMEKGFHEFVYASPFCGFAQLALAQAGAAAGTQVTLFCEARPEFPQTGSLRAHELSEACRSSGATVILCRTLAEAEEKAQTYSEKSEQTFKIPLGFNHEVFLELYRKKIAEQLPILRRLLGTTPRTIWLPIGSGTLARVFRSITPAEVHLNCVDVHVLAKSDLRLQSLANLPNVRIYSSPQLFHDRSLEVPPVPSNKYYDAKLWSFIREHAGQDDVWWNVAR